MVALLYWIAKLELETIKVEIADFPFFSHQLIVKKKAIHVPWELENRKKISFKILRTNIKKKHYRGIDHLVYAFMFWENCLPKDLFMSFGMIFGNVILGWYYNILGWKLSKQTSF